MHLIRRNLDCQIMLFNNEIYGLTKGQYSPTSRVGTTSPSTPYGSVDRPAQPAAFALGAGARFVARGFDVSKELPTVLKAAHAHKGAALDRKSVVTGKRVSVRVDLGGRRIFKKKKTNSLNTPN